MVSVNVCEDDINLLKRIIRRKISEVEINKEFYKSEYNQLVDILERVIKLGVSDSILLIGPSNCGKTTFVRILIDDLVNKFGSESFISVRLNGLVHINDNLALQEIIRSLHVNDLPEASIVTGSFADNLSFVLQSFKSGNREATKPVVFIIDEFQHFCEHSNQTLLYNLFDVAQASQAPIFVLGITPRIDITEMFEKRVKSRFSQRQISLYPITDYKYYLNIIEKVFTVNENKEVKKIKNFITKWNSSVKEFIKDIGVIKIIRQITEFEQNLKLFKNILYCLTNYINQSHFKLGLNDLNKSVGLFFEDRKVSLIKDLSILELCLVITMKHQNEIFDCEPMNFEMVYQRYMKFAANSSVNSVQYPVLYKAFERLREMEVIVPISGPGRRTKKKEFVLYSFVLTGEQIDRALSSYENLPTDITQWASSSLAVA